MTRIFLQMCLENVEIMISLLIVILFYPAFGNNQLRVEWMERLKQIGGRIATIVHKMSYISPTSEIGDGIVIMPQSLISSFSKMKDGIIIKMGAIVEHNCLISTGCHICLVRLRQQTIGYRNM